MLGLILCSFLVFDIQSGFSLEPSVGWQFVDKVDEPKLLGGIRLTYLEQDSTDALVTAEIGFTSATTLLGEGKTPDTDYVYDLGILFYEFYSPAVFRLGLGASAEQRQNAMRPGLYYRGSLGRTIGKRFAVYTDLTGRALFRADKTSFPLALGLSVQIIF